MSNLLAVSEEIETKLKELSLVGSRLGSGFCYVDNSRDVQFEYKKDVTAKIEEITNDYHAKIEEVVKDVISKYDDLRVSFTYRLDNFSFYISPKREEVECKDEVCEDECCEEDGTCGDSISGLMLYSNRAEILLNVVNYGLAHMTFTADDISELSGIQEELMKYVEKDK